MQAKDFFSGLKDIAKNTSVLSQASLVMDLITDNSIEQGQKTSLDRIRKVAYDALETKRRIKNIYWFTKWKIDEDHVLAEGLKKGKMNNFLESLLEDG